MLLATGGLDWVRRGTVRSTSSIDGVDALPALFATKAAASSRGGTCGGITEAELAFAAMWAGMIKCKTRRNSGQSSSRSDESSELNEFLPLARLPEELQSIQLHNNHQEGPPAMRRECTAT